MSEIEKQLRALWTAKGVPADRQDAMIADTIGKAQAGAKVGPFTIAEDITPEGVQFVMPGCEKDRTKGKPQMELF